MTLGPSTDNRALGTPPCSTDRPPGRLHIRYGGAPNRLITGQTAALWLGVTGPDSHRFHRAIVHGGSCSSVRRFRIRDMSLTSEQARVIATAPRMPAEV